MELGVFIPIGNNGWLISTTSPQYLPSFDLNPPGRREGRAFRFRLRAVDDQAAWVRRTLAVLGPQSRIIHVDGGTGGGNHAHPTFRLGRRVDHTAALGGTNGGDDRLNLARALRHQRRFRLAAGGIRADGDLARCRALCPPLRILCRIRDHNARAVGDGTVRLQGWLFYNGRLPLQSLAAGADQDHRCRAERSRDQIRCKYCDYNFCASYGVNEPTGLHRASSDWSTPLNGPGAMSAR
jgi:hypothetical protein